MPPEEAPAAAAEAVADLPDEAPTPEGAEEALPEGDTFPREYVEKTRAEAAKWRTQFREIDGAFEGYTPEEKTRFLELAGKLASDPESAYEEFVGVTERLAKQLGKETKVAEETPTPEAAPEAGPAALDAAAIEKIVSDRLAAERAEVQQQTEVERTFAEAEALDPAYKDKAAKAHLFAVATENGTDLAGAHEIITGQLNAVIEQAIEEYREGLRTGKAHAPRLPVGDPTAGTEVKGQPKTLEEARKRGEERMNALYGG